ncbi:LytTR family transcriptional regulator [Prolixibacteraceae bacterium JC049]|nr:LytTR family transcriptional regulator [Prolixibacteraceae bacterium JC049]
MIKKLKNPYYHIAYWIFVIIILTTTFGSSWKNTSVAFFFVCMLLPIVLGTSYFFNYVLVPKFYLTKRYLRFAFYSFCTAIVSVYLEMLVLLFSFVYLENLNFSNLSPNSTKIIILAIVLYLLVFIGSFLLMMHQITENRQIIQQLIEEKEKSKKSFLEIMSNRKLAKIAYEDIVYIESLSDYIKVVTTKNEVTSKERISKLVTRLPDTFLRIHRSFIINKDKISSISSDQVTVNETQLNIGRSYRKIVKESLNSKL